MPVAMTRHSMRRLAIIDPSPFPDRHCGTRGELPPIHIVMAGQSRSKNGVASLAHSHSKNGVASLAHSHSKNGVASLAYSHSKNGVVSLAYVSRPSRSGTQCPTNRDAIETRACPS